MIRKPDISPKIGLKGCFIAGGAVLSALTNSEINDYDIYPKNKEALKDILLLLNKECVIVKISEKTITFKSNHIYNSNNERITLQVVILDYYDDPEKLIQTFDFTVCMAAFDCDTKEYYFGENFYPDIATKTLSFSGNTIYPFNSFLRSSKYVKKGFEFPKQEMIKLSLAIAKKGFPNSWEELENEIGGSYGKNIKLNSENLKFNFENAMYVLSKNGDLENRSNDVININIHDLISVVTNEKIEYVKNDNDIIVLIQDSYNFRIFDNRVLKYFSIPSSFKQLSDKVLYGYKTKYNNTSHETVRFQTTSPNMNCYFVSFNATDIIKKVFNDLDVRKTKIEK